MDKQSKTFVMHVAPLKTLLARLLIYSDRKAQIASVIAKEIKILDKYSNFANVFLEKKAMMLPKQIKLNNHNIKLENGKQPLYGPIYSLELVELETLKTYIKTYQKTGFIQSFKSLTGAPILFNKKLDCNL